MDCRCLTTPILGSSRISDKTSGCDMHLILEYNKNEKSESQPKQQQSHNRCYLEMIKLK